MISQINVCISLEEIRMTNWKVRGSVGGDSGEKGWEANVKRLEHSDGVVAGTAMTEKDREHLNRDQHIENEKQWVRE